MDGPGRAVFSTAPEKIIMPDTLTTTPALSQITHLAQKYLESLPHGRTEGRQLYRGPDGKVIGDWFGLGLASAFQPIVEAGSRQVVGHEAFLRSASPDDQGLYPWTLFSSAADDDRVIALDRLARTVHLLNSIVGGNQHPLFLNVHGRLLAAVADDHGRAFRRVVNALDQDAQQIVIETPVDASHQPDLLTFVLRNYRNNGFKVAVNIESIDQWRQLAHGVWPHYIKVDARKLGTGLELLEHVHTLTQLSEDARVVLTHVETPLDIPADLPVLLQGYAIAHPSRGVENTL